MRKNNKLDQQKLNLTTEHGREPYTDYKKYYINVTKDVREAMTQYPFIKIVIQPTVEPTPVLLEAIAVNKKLLDETGAIESDFTNEHSKKVEILVPYNYKIDGCKIYGGKWIPMESMPDKYRHFNGKRKDGKYLLCVGVPNSFSALGNVILENLQTTEKMLTAYELYVLGETEKLELFAYSHGKKGIEEYERERKRRKVSY